MSQDRARLCFAFAFLCAAICAVSGQACLAQSSESASAGPAAGSDAQPFIVLLKHQPAAQRVGSFEESQRVAGFANEQQPLLDEVRGASGAHIKSYRLLNAFAATAPQAEIDKLKANSAVATVIPDTVIIGKKQAAKLSQLSLAGTAGGAAANAAATGSAAPKLNVIPGACDGVQLAPEGLALTHTDSMDRDPTARSLGATGAGVKVAFIADGVDPANENFIRRDGLSAFDPSIGGDYVDFTGDGLNAVTSGGESFLDANTIAGQGHVVYDVSQGYLTPDLPHCYVRIEGMAPDAALVGLKAFATNNLTTTSNLLQAIDYAVEVDHVDVINESFGGNPYPATALDAVKQFDEAAVAAGVFVSVASGDAGPSNTIDSPSNDPLLMTVGASTQFQAYAQINLALNNYFSTGWLSNNIATFSSSGFTEAGNTIDLVAPGDASFASCSLNDTYQACVSFPPLPWEPVAGTSESSPFVAGAAALVIQAYRRTHDGESPSPALIKRILLSSASDLGAPAVEQGAGLLDTYQAVLLAESVGDRDDNHRSRGNSLLLSTNQLNTVAEPGSSHSWTVDVSNTGDTRQTVFVSGRTLGPDSNVQTGSVTLNVASSPEVMDFSGYQNEYGTFHFTVPQGADRLNVSMAYRYLAVANVGDLTANLILVDPAGRLAGVFEASGVSDYGYADVIAPAPGNWTGVISGPVVSGAGLNESIPWRAAMEQYVPFATASPDHLTLEPGERQPVTISATTPLSAGDTDGSIVLSSNRGPATTIPVTLRSLIDVSAGGGFSGTLTGGNGRGAPFGQNLFYQFQVGPGARNIAANVIGANDPKYYLGLYLISPDGNALGQGASLQKGPVSAYTLNPSSGLWTLILNNPVPDGTEVSQAFTGNVALSSSSVTASAPALPNSANTRLAAGVPVTIPVTITNGGAGAGSFFVDARLDDSRAPVLLPNQTLTSSISLPLAYDAATPYWLVPTETSAITATQNSTLPAMFDLGFGTGDADISSSRFSRFGSSLCSRTTSASYTPAGRKVAQGLWYLTPSECGPYAGAAESGQAEIELWAITKAFDPAVTSSTGDLWIYSVNPASTKPFTPRSIAAGGSSTIDVTITPQGAHGTLVSGKLYISDFLAGDLPDFLPTADEVIELPYRYTIQ